MTHDHHVLVVEDDADVREMLQTMLRVYGYTTDAAANGAIGLERMRQRTPCVVLLDLMMPVIDGWKFREEQLKDPALRDVPVICITAVFDQHFVKKALDLPCMAKPVDIDELRGAVQDACKTGETVGE